jgi:hypothetical protein
MLDGFRSVIVGLLQSSAVCWQGQFFGGALVRGSLCFMASNCLIKPYLG